MRLRALLCVVSGARQARRRRGRLLPLLGAGAGAERRLIRCGASGLLARRRLADVSRVEVRDAAQALHYRRGLRRAQRDGLRRLQADGRDPVRPQARRPRQEQGLGRRACRHQPVSIRGAPPSAARRAGNVPRCPRSRAPLETTGPGRVGLGLGACTWGELVTRRWRRFTAAFGVRRGTTPGRGPTGCRPRGPKAQSSSCPAQAR